MLFKSFNVVRSIVSAESTGWGHFSSICLFWDGISYSLASLRVTVEPRMTLNFSHYCLCPVWGTGIIEPNSPFMASILLAEQHPSPYRRKLSSGVWPLRKTETRAWSSDHRLDWTSTKTHSTWLLSSRSLSPLVFLYVRYPRHHAWPQFVSVQMEKEKKHPRVLNRARVILRFVSFFFCCQTLSWENYYLLKMR